MHGSEQMHYIQRSIISALAQNSPLRFSQLQPQDIPNNTFSYHLKALKERGYITQSPNGYTATRKAYKAFPYTTEQNDASNQGPIVLSVVHITNAQGQTLLLKRKRKPFDGMYGVPSGLVHKGEDLLDAASRQLNEKTSLTAKNQLEPAGILNFQYLEKSSKDVFIHALALIYTYHIADHGEELEGRTNKYGKLHWSDFDHENILPEAIEINTIARAPFYTVLSAEFDEPDHEKINR